MATIHERRPCSACGATADDIAILAKSEQLKQLICRKCGVRGPYRPDNERAVCAWNSLHGAPAQTAASPPPVPAPAPQTADAEPVDAVLRLVPGGNPLFEGIPYVVTRLKGHAAHCIIETDGETVLRHLGYTGGQYVFVIGPKIEENTFTGSFHTLRDYADVHDVFRIRSRSLDLWHRLNRIPAEHGGHFMRGLTSRVWYARYQDGPPILDLTPAGRSAIVLRIVIGNDDFRDKIHHTPHQFTRGYH